MLTEKHDKDNDESNIKERGEHLGKHGVENITANDDAQHVEEIISPAAYVFLG